MGQSEKDQKLVNVLNGYRREGEQSRASGTNPRDRKWDRNLDLYHNRVDFSNKADWQAKTVMPEVPSYVDRFAAAMKEALTATPTGFYTVTDPADRDEDFTPAIKSITDAWLTVIGNDSGGGELAFPAVFEEHIKMGALMAMASSVTWDARKQRVAMEVLDPRTYWRDHTGRGLYRFRKIEIDRHDLIEMGKASSSKGNAIYKVDNLKLAISKVSEEIREARATASGNGQEYVSNRQPVSLTEYIATALDDDGNYLANNQLIVVANDEFIVRGPEDNPYWHGDDWVTFTPLIGAPMSPYGRSYMEDFGDIASTFTELTNLILDAVKMSSMNAFVMVPEMLLDVTQANEGVHPSKVFKLEDGYTAKDFIAEISLGSLDQGAMAMWTTLKGELSEAAGINQVGLGQFAPNSRTSATEINTTQQSSSALVRSIASTVETRFLNPVLDLTWKTGLQHVKVTDPMLSRAAGPEMWAALHGQRRELIKRPITFQAQGISAIIQKQQTLSALMQLLQIAGSNPNLAQAFMARVDMNKLLSMMFSLSGIDPSKLAPSQRDTLMASVTQPLEQAGQGAGGAGGGPGNFMDQAAQALGIAR